MDPEIARSRLEAERRRLEETRRAALDLVSGTTEEAAVPEVDSSVLQSVEAELAEIEAALGRVDAGTYGTCELCGEPVSDGRLEAMPAARYCVEDQARAGAPTARR